MEKFLRAEIDSEKTKRYDAVQESKKLAAERDRLDATQQAALIGNSGQQECLEGAYRVRF